jgi:3-oxoacyl-[acyl-carrier protein] reductase
MARFDGRVLFATGGGSGIAAATARRFTADGGRVAVVDLDGDRARAVAAELPGAVGLACDVADEASVAAAVGAAHDQLGSVDCVLNAAGHAEFGPVEEWPVERWNRMMTVHAGGTFLVTKHVLPLMKAQGRGSIVNVASTAALAANLHNAPYGAAKGAILAFSRQVARDVAPHIRVNTIVPGRTRTGMTEPLFTQRWGSYEEGAEAFVRGVPLQRLGEPDELAAPICFLLSDDASFITGTSLVVDGGETAV